MIHYDTLLKNATDIVAKCDISFITKCDRSLLLNASGFLLQNATVLLQNMAVVAKWGNFITKCDGYYKLRQCTYILEVEVKNNVVEDENVLKTVFPILTFSKCKCFCK